MANPSERVDLDVINLFLETPLYLRVPVGDAGEAVKAILIFAGTLDTYCPGCGMSATFRGIVTSEVEQKLKSVFKVESGFSGQVGQIRHLWDRREFSKFLQCTRQGHPFFFHFLSEAGAITKVGQYPSLADLEKPGTQKYKKLLGDTRLKELNRAIGLAAHGVGVGAYVYLRRLFESLIEEAHVQAAAKVSGWDETAYMRQRTAERVATLESFLPEFLVANPRLYGILSLGVHELTEEQCLANFEALKLCIQVTLDEKLIHAERKEHAQAARNALETIDPRKR